MKFLVLCMLVATSACHGAASQPVPSSNVFAIKEHSMPYKVASNAAGDLTCIVADPKLLNQLPEDFAKQVITNMGDKHDAATFKSALFNLHAEHLSTEHIKAHVTSVHLALLISSKPGVVNIIWQPKATASVLSFRSHSFLTLTRSGNIFNPTTTPAYAYVGTPKKDTSTRLEEFGKQTHIRMLLKKGDTDTVAELTKEFLSKPQPTARKSSADFVLEIKPLPGDGCCLQ